MTDTEPGALLDELTALRRKTKQDSHGYWLPLLMFGALVLAGSLAYRGPTGTDVEGPAVTVGSTTYLPFQLFSGLVFDGNPTVVGWYWLAATVLGAIATMVWYRLRGDRTGLRVSNLRFLLGLFVVLVIMLVVVPLVSQWTLPLFASQVATLWVSVGVFVIGLLLTVLGWRSRPMMIVGALICLLAAGNVVALAPLHGFGGLLVIGLGLFCLAWAERSIGCAVTATVFTGAALLTNLYDMENIFGRLFGFTDKTTVIAFYSLLVPALVLLGGGVVALLGAHRGTR